MFCTVRISKLSINHSISARGYNTVQIFAEFCMQNVFPYSLVYIHLSKSTRKYEESILTPVGARYTLIRTTK